MKIAIISDNHFGYATGTERQEDSFVQAREAFEEALKEADVIVNPGDIFDSRVPKQEVMEKAAKIFSLALQAKNTGVRVVDSYNVEKIPNYTVAGVPIIAIHGTHERRGSNMVNPVETLEAAGLLVHIHLGYIVLEKDGEQVAIHGMSGVPEPQARDALMAWSPKPVKGAHNIIMFHQSFKEMVNDPSATLIFDDLPPGFDLYINGHIHWHSVNKKDGKLILHPGSTITTQMRKNEAENPKGFCFYDTLTSNIDFVPLKSQRKLYYKEIKASGSPGSVVDEAMAFLKSIPQTELKPMVKLKITGSLTPGATIDLREITHTFDDKLIMSVDDQTETEDFKKKIASLRDLHKQKASVLERSLDILTENLKQAGYEGIPPDKLLGVLEDGDVDKALEILMKEKEGA
ncbi:MAG: metallophosphoesterase family protein [Candidatus Diapherotrites archaeon]|nr:metallophosphoesterase family protein [Candidatus Diapherotrites archaeon]